jgi:hypothetical protein
MNYHLTFRLLFILTIFLLASCGSSTKITGSWRTMDSEREMYFQSYAIIVLSEKNTVRAIIEQDLVSAMKKYGHKAVRGIDVFPPTFQGKELDKKTILDTFRHHAVDAIITVSLLDVESETRYVPGQVNYAPAMRFGWYGSFWGYYSHWYPRVYQPGYYTEDKVYYIEVNLYDVKNESLLWSAQSETHNPSDLHIASKNFAGKVVTRMRKDGVLNDVRD